MKLNYYRNHSNYRTDSNTRCSSRYGNISQLRSIRGESTSILTFTELVRISSVFEGNPSNCDVRMFSVDIVVPHWTHLTVSTGQVLSVIDRMGETGVVKIEHVINAEELGYSLGLEAVFIFILNKNFYMHHIYILY